MYSRFLKSAGLPACSFLLFVAIGCTSDIPAASQPIAALGAASPAAAPLAAPTAAARPDTATNGAAPAVPAAALQTPQPIAPTPIATAEGGAVNGLRVEVTRLKRRDDGTVDLRLTVINDSDSKRTYGEMGFARLDEVYLIDLVGRKKYFVVKDGEGSCVCDDQVSYLERRSRVNRWARFPAPSDDVERISIVIPNFPPIEDVPLSRSDGVRP